RYIGKPPLGAVQKIVFEQLDRSNWKVQVEAQQCTDIAALDSQVTELVRNTFGADCRVQTSIVARIPREPSGKFRYYRSSPALRTGPGSPEEAIGTTEAVA